IALQETLGDISLIQRYLGPFIVGKQRHLVPRPGIGIDDAAGFMRGVSSVTQFLPEVAVTGLSRRIKYAAVDVVFPAVVDAAQAALFVAAVEKRGSAVRTTLAKQPDAPPAVAKGNQLFAQHPYANRRTVRLGNLLGQKCGNPITPNQITHGCPWVDLG